MWLLFFLITGCHFEPLLTPCEQPQSWDICVKSKDHVLAHLLKKELLFHQALLLKDKSYRLHITINDDINPLIYSSKGDIERWHECLKITLTVAQNNQRYVRQLSSYSSFQDQGDFGYVSLHERTQEKLIQDMVQQIIREVAWLFQTPPVPAQASSVSAR